MDLCGPVERVLQGKGGAGVRERENVKVPLPCSVLPVAACVRAVVLLLPVHALPARPAALRFDCLSPDARTYQNGTSCCCGSCKRCQRPP